MGGADCVWAINFADIVIVGVIGGVDCVRGKAINLPLADVVIVGVVGRGDFDGASTKVPLDKRVEDDRQTAIDEGMSHELAVEVSVTRILSKKDAKSD